MPLPGRLLGAPEQTDGVLPGKPGCTLACSHSAAMRLCTLLSPPCIGFPAAQVHCTKPQPGRARCRRGRRRQRCCIARCPCCATCASAPCQRCGDFKLPQCRRVAGTGMRGSGVHSPCKAGAAPACSTRRCLALRPPRPAEQQPPRRAGQLCPRLAPPVLLLQRVPGRPAGRRRQGPGCRRGTPGCNQQCSRSSGFSRPAAAQAAGSWAGQQRRRQRRGGRRPGACPVCGSELGESGAGGDSGRCSAGTRGRRRCRQRGGRWRIAAACGAALALAAAAAAGVGGAHPAATGSGAAGAAPSAAQVRGRGSAWPNCQLHAVWSPVGVL